jgi:co-chaperonin GroES (HSP10)
MYRYQHDSKLAAFTIRRIMKPLKNYVLVTEAKQETTTASGIVLSGSVEKGAKPGIVEAVGQSVEQVAIGDKVAVVWDKGMRVDANKVLVSEDFILGVY